MNTIKEQWERFSDLIIPQNAPEIQKEEMRRAFYCGVEAMSRIQFNIGDSSVTEDEAIKILEGIHQECELFAAELAGNLH